MRTLLGWTQGEAGPPAPAEEDLQGPGEAQATETGGDGFSFDFLTEPLFSVRNTDVTLVSVVLAAAIILLGYRISRLIQALIAQGLKRAGVEDTRAIGRIQRLTHYAVVVLAFLVAVGTIGIELNALLAAGAVFAVAFGFAMQEIAQNFVSGLILLVERTISEGDVLEVESRVVRVHEMGIRATIVRTRDDEELIVPNAKLVQSTVKNYTLGDNVFRLRAFVGVEYGSDMELVRNTLEETTRSLEWRHRERSPRVHLLDFGDNAVNWEASVWIRNPWTAPELLSKLNEAIWFALKEKGVVIAFPQRDIHLDPQVTDALRRIADAVQASE